MISDSESDSLALLRVNSLKPVTLLKFTGNKDNLLERTFKQMAINSHLEKIPLSTMAMFFVREPEIRLFLPERKTFFL